MAGSDKRNGMMATAVIVLLLSLMGAGAGFAVGVLLQPAKEPEKPPAQPAPAEAPKATTAGEAPSEAKPSAGEASLDETAADEDAPADADLKVVTIPPVLTTLAAPEGKWIRLEGAILAKPGGAKPPDLLAEEAGEQVLAYLRTVRLDQLQGPSGYLALRDDLNETVRSMSRGDVQGLLIHGLLVE